MQQMNAFAPKADKKLESFFPGVEETTNELQKYYELKKIELSAKDTPENRKALKELEEYYTETLSLLASKILDNDYDYNVAYNKHVVLTPEMRRNIKVYRNQLLRKGIIRVEKGSKPFCVVCGKKACSGDLFVMLHKDNSAACLDCCTSGTELDNVTELVFID